MKWMGNFEKDLNPAINKLVMDAKGQERPRDWKPINYVDTEHWEKGK